MHTKSFKDHVASNSLSRARVTICDWYNVLAIYMLRSSAALNHDLNSTSEVFEVFFIDDGSFPSGSQSVMFWLILSITQFPANPDKQDTGFPVHAI